ncbi:hypothetical protein [Catenovulum agarivorans]|uniref:hypothetical protein n=1 Tax=Catenovulum agarivorans TaxID=1172192 RepID=UPI0002E4AD41|nr:hypothetical protein [Catenovulum agarivorans]
MWLMAAQAFSGSTNDNSSLSSATEQSHGGIKFSKSNAKLYAGIALVALAIVVVA